MQLVRVHPVIVPVENRGIFCADFRDKDMRLNAPVDGILVDALRDQGDFFGIFRGIFTADVRCSVCGSVVMQQNVKRVLRLLHQHALDGLRDKRRVVVRR
ncbi:hypothetical protein SDC9_182420 [bioreactor metagenome]|uniref:Uncharacterized protein n=1 Tax=bioreactor metagenome TaxID=1076179 RepID=A0A645H8T5_9ZZZZ